MPAPSFTPDSLTEGWTSLSPRCRFRLSGPDRVRYLNGQVTNQVEGLRAGIACYACVTNHKGQLEADMVISAGPDPLSGEEALWIDAAEALREPLAQRLDRYLIADDAELHDASDDWTGFHCLMGESGEDRETRDWAERLMEIAPRSHAHRIDRLGVPGVDWWIPGGDGSAKAREGLTALGLSELSSDAIEWLRIRRSIPVWGAELKPGMLPQEARLERRAIHYEKGCYIGQEVISRMKRAGKVNRLMVLLRPIDDDTAEASPLAAGWDLCLPSKSDANGEPKPLGAVTSVASAPTATGEPGMDSGAGTSRGERLALAWVRSQHAAPGTELLASSGNDATKVVVVPFPDSQD